MKIKSHKLIGQNGKMKEHFTNEFNSKGLIQKTEYLDEFGKVKFYSMFEYDLNGNCISKKMYDDKDTLQGYYNWEFDNQNRNIKSIEFTTENKIWEWHEKEFPNENTIVYLSREPNGLINHKTVEHLEKGLEERFDSNEILYSKVIKKIDKDGRLINSKTLNKNNKVIQEDKYLLKEQTKIWQLYIDGKYIKSEEETFDKNGNQIFYIRKDHNNESLEWSKSEYDSFGNRISIIGGFKLNNTTYKSSIEIEYKQ